MPERSEWMARRVYSAAWRKELVEWRNNPHTSSMSDAMKDHARLNRHKPKQREAKMCQACGAVSIIGSDRLRESNESKHGAYYCDKECAESDRARVYRTSQAYQAKCDARYQREGKKRNWEKAVCKVFFPTCRVCGKLFSAGNKSTVALCSAKCRRIDIARKVKIKRRNITQTPKETHCSECGVWFTTLVRTRFDQHYCSTKCSRRYCTRQLRHVRRELMRLSDGQIRGVVSLKGQFKKWKGVCQICGCKTEMLKDYSPNQATVDHKIPLSKGGLHVEENVQLACHACNSAKSDNIQGGRQLMLY
jgi:hypothetical protein